MQNALAQFVLAAEYAQCMAAVPAAVAEPQIGTEVALQAPCTLMSDTRTSMLAAAIAYDTPLTHEDRCACYEQGGDVVGSSLGTRGDDCKGDDTRSRASDVLDASDEHYVNCR